MKHARLLAALLFVAATQLFAELPPLIARDVLFGNTERTAPQLSPDGKRLAWLAPDKKNVLQVWVKTLGKDDDKAVTADKKRGVRIYRWARDNKTLLYLQDDDGNENFQLYGVDLDTGNVRDYTPIQGTRADIINLDATLPDQVLVALNARDRRFFDAYRLQLSTGALVPDTQNPGDVDSWFAGPLNEVMVVQAVDPKDGSVEIRARKNHLAAWKASPQTASRSTSRRRSAATPRAWCRRTSRRAKRSPSPRRPRSTPATSSSIRSRTPSMRCRSSRDGGSGRSSIRR